jgi:queuine/archaeosine tRNA-ribosyltransferase
MGVGMPIDLLEAVHRGVDMFDRVLPTALAQQGVAFTSRGRIDLARASATARRTWPCTAEAFSATGSRGPCARATSSRRSRCSRSPT